MTDDSRRANPCARAHRRRVEVLSDFLNEGITICCKLLRIMDKRICSARVCVALTVFAAAAVHGQSNLAIRAIAEVETKVVQNGRETSKLLPADRVVPGDQIIYTLEIRNTGAMALPPPKVDYPVPEHMRYVADSASGPGADISYSIDGGRTFDRPENLKIVDSEGVKQVASAGSYTHIRWQLKNILKADAVAFARFRAVVK
jgi:uncharacterized repeat protein (TIGR01451 family)